MIEHPQKEQRAELDKHKAENERRAFDVEVAKHERQIDALLHRHLVTQDSPFVEYTLDTTLQGVGLALLNKYEASGWRVTCIESFDMGASLAAMMNGQSRKPELPKLRFF